MRVTFVIPGSAGGGARSVMKLANGLICRGHTVRMVHPKSQHGLKDALRNAYVGMRFGQRQDWLRAFRGEVVEYTELTAEVVGPNDAVVGVGVDCMLAVAHLPDVCGAKVHNCHGMEPWIMERMKRAWALPVPRIICASYIEPEMRKLGSADPIYIVPNGVDADTYYPDANAGPRDGVGTVYHKGLPKDPVTVRAVLWKLYERMPTVPLYVFGISRPPKAPPTVRSIKYPTLNQARGCYARSLVWFCGSRNEGFSMPLLEAMACGCAVVSTDCGGPADFVEPGTNGYLVPVGAAEQLAERIVDLLDDRRQLAGFAAAALDTAAKFSWEGAVDKLEVALNQITAMEPIKTDGSV